MGITWYLVFVLKVERNKYYLPYKVCHFLSHQLFKKPHPPKRVRSRLNGDNMGLSVPPGCTSDKIFFHHLDNLRPSLTPVKGKIRGNKLSTHNLMRLFQNPSIPIKNCFSAVM